jgi:hypothetical protein
LKQLNYHVSTNEHLVVPYLLSFAEFLRFIEQQKHLGTELEGRLGILDRENLELKKEKEKLRKQYDECICALEKGEEERERGKAAAGNQGLKQSWGKCI